MILTESTSEAEKVVFGSILRTAGKCLDDIALTGDDFEQAAHGELFDSMRKLHDQGKAVTIPMLMAGRSPEDELFLIQLDDYGYLAYAVTDHADLVASRGMHRRLIAATHGIQQLDPSTPVADMTDRARALVDAAAGEQKSKVRFIRDILPSVIESMKAHDTFIPTPWPTLNRAIGGLRPGAVYVVAARPGMGKTVIAAQLAAEMAKHGMVAFSSLEMSEDELTRRLIAERLSLLVGRVKDNKMTDRDWAVLESRQDELAELNIAIDDRTSIAATDVKAFARSVSRHGKLSAIVVDYLQLMTSRSKLDRHLQVSEFSRQLKIMAKEFKVPVIALSQLNRNSEARADNVPKLSDLRESGAIEQDADVVILLRREGDMPHERIVLDVAKNRHGVTGEVDLSWQGEFSRAVEF